MKNLLTKKTLPLAIGLVVAASAQAQDSIDEILVVGSRASLASALEKQRNSDKVVGVIDSDAIGNFADINVAESLRRISGIMVENDQGEGR
ncbi:MAG: TonB-dependent receptor, partial [OM182 bacterium]